MEQGIIEINKLIAVFMGGKFFKDTEMILEIKVLSPTTGNYISCADKLKYHTSWDWLMDVWIKIKNILVDTAQFPHRFWYHDASQAILNGDIKRAHKEIVEGIKHYNQSK